MHTFKHILHPTDFSDRADDTLAYALDLAVREEAALEILHVVEDKKRYDAYTPFPGAEEESLRIRLKEKTNERFSGLQRGDLDALQIQYTLVGAAHATPAILEHLARHPKDLVVMGTHGRRGVSRLLLGSVTEVIIREAPCPVFTFRHRVEEKPVEVTQILAPIDFSEPSAEALAYARHLAALYDATLTLLFVAEEHIVSHFTDTGIPTFTVLKMEGEMIQRAALALRQLNERTAGPACQARYEVRSGSAAHTILDYAKEHGMDLIVMATRGLAGAAGLMGSVTNHVVRAASCPVFTLKDTDVE
ncbi:MAG TPA: universal stress protein [Rhodothermales bacterium]|nr:universal stress protein [Rhodothermales bacterium]